MSGSFIRNVVSTSRFGTLVLIFALLTVLLHTNNFTLPKYDYTHAQREYEPSARRRFYGCLIPLLLPWYHLNSHPSNPLYVHDCKELRVTFWESFII